jgi:hypothetical protein
LTHISVMHLSECLECNAHVHEMSKTKSFYWKMEFL